MEAQGQFGHPHGQLQRGAQVLVAEDDASVHGAAGLLPVHENVIAVCGNLCVKGVSERKENQGRNKIKSSI